MSSNGITNGALTPLKNSLRGVYDQAYDNFGAMKSKLNDVKLAAKVSGGTLIARAAQLIKANPMKAVAAAFAVGYIAMRVVRR